MPPLTTPLNPVHLEAGASMTDFAGWSMPLRYGSELAEHHAVRTSAGIFDLSHMAQLAITGEQAAEFLDFALVSKLGALAIGRAKYTMIVDGDGHVLDDLVVYRLAEQEFLVVANAANRHTVVQALTERIGGYGANLVDRTGTRALIAVQGPKALRLIAELADIDPAPLRYYAANPGRVAGIDVLLARTGYTGEDGFELFVDASDAIALWRQIDQVAGEGELTWCGLAARDTLRLEAGMPLYGHELTADLTPFDAGLGRVVALDKADFVGKHALEQAAASQPSRRLVGLRAEGRRAPRSGYVLLDPDGARVGQITSGALSPTLGYSIAMGYLDSALAEPGTTVSVDLRGKAMPITVVPTPFYRRSK